MDETTPTPEPSPDYSEQLNTIIEQNRQVIELLDHVYTLQHAQADALSLLTGVVGVVGLIAVIAVGIYIVRS